MDSKRFDQITPDCQDPNECATKRSKYRWARLLLPVTGFFALIWFFIRVIPKPSRATYPCQRVAFPLASSFVIWLLGLGGSVAAIRKARLNFNNSRRVVAAVCVLLSIGSVWLAMSVTSEKPAAAAQPHPVNSPIGQARGIYPGRVVWVHDTDATSWDGSTGYWWQSGNTDQTVVSDMLDRAIRRLGGNANTAAAWDAIFRYYNQQHGKGDVGYAPGEKIMIKVNFVGTLTTATYLSASNYDLGDSWGKENYPNTSPQMMMALLDQLVNEAGVSQANIYIGDTTAFFPNEFYNLLHAVFPSVHYVDHPGDNGRTEATLSAVPFYWSTTAANGKTQDYIPNAFVDAEYVISLANLKGHYDQAGVTLCAKNHYGSLYRRPNATGYYDLHGDLPFTNSTEGSYRNLVDLMGHEDLGGKTMLCVIDGLYAARHQGGNIPVKWDLAPFNNDWTNSVLVSQDPVAIDSVGFDFLYAEWPEFPGPAVGGADDYLHEAALADDPPSGSFYDPEDDGTSVSGLGVHEHWNDPVNKQYSRNLGTGEGIELATPPMEEIASDLSYDGAVNCEDFAILAESWDGTAMSALADMVTDWLRVAVETPPVTVYDGDFVLPWVSQTTGGSEPVAWQDSTAPDATAAAYCNIVPGQIWRWTRLNTNGSKVNIGSRRYLEFDIYFNTTVKPGHKLSAVQMEVNDQDEWGYKWESKVGVAGDSYCWLDGVYMDMDGGIPDNDLPMTGNQWHHFKLDLTTNIDGRVWPADADVGKILLCFGHDAGSGVDVYIKNVEFTAAAGNAAPYVYGGGDMSITLPETSVDLDGTVYDDGKPNPPGAVTTTWEKISGPDPVYFGDASAVDTSVTFPGAGAYVLRLTADDGDLTASDEVQVTVRQQGYPAESVIVFQNGSFANSWSTGLDFSIAQSPDGKTCAYTNGNSWRSMEGHAGTVVDRDGYFEFDIYFQGSGTSLSCMHMQVNGDDGWQYKWQSSSVVWIDGVQLSWNSASLAAGSWHHFRFKLSPASVGGTLPLDAEIGDLRFYLNASTKMYLNNIAFTPY